MLEATTRQPIFPWYGNYGPFIGFGVTPGYSLTLRLSARVMVYRTHAARRTAEILCHQCYETTVKGGDVE